MATIAEAERSNGLEKPLPVTDNWFVLLREPEDFEEFAYYIRRSMEDARIAGDQLKVSVQRIRKSS